MIFLNGKTKRRLWLRGIAILLCAVLLVSMTACSGEPSSSGVSLEYTISKGAGRHTLRVWLTVGNTVVGEPLRLYLSGNDFEIKSVTDLQEKPCAYTQQEDYLDVTPSGDTLTVYYTVTVGEPGKHGRAGIATDAVWAASGEQLLLMPLEAYSVDEAEVSQAVSRISIQVKTDEDRQISAPTGRWNKVNWNLLYQLRQSAFAVGSFQRETCKIGGATVYLDYATEQQQSAVSHIRSMLTYYADLFGELPDRLHICLLDTTDGEEYVMGGAGGYAMAATFLPENRRDWELLAHRLFHACYEQKNPHYAVHMPGNLWFYEGLAGCYEWLATGYALEEQGRAENGVAELYAKYLYLYAQYPDLRVRAVDESAITEESAAKTEFLHYYVAPLLVYPLLSAETKPGETVRQLASWMNTATLEEDQVLLARLGDTPAGKAVLEQAQSTGCISRPPEVTLTASETELVPLLAAAEEHLTSWLRLEDADFTYESVESVWLDTAIQVAQKRGTSCTADADLSKTVSEFSPALSRILAAMTLRQEIVSSFEDTDENLSVKWLLWLRQQSE